MSQTQGMATEEALFQENQTFKERLGQVRHDLKTPVGHILGYSEMLAEDLEDDPWEEFEEYLKFIHKSGEELLSLIEELLGPGKTSLEDIDFTGAQFRLRQQLNQVTGYCELAHEVLEDEGRDEYEADLNHILEASKVFTGIVDSILTPASFTHLVSEAEREKKEQQDSAEEAKVVSSGLGEGGTLLVVDDNPANLELLTRRLERQGYQTIQASNGQQALDLLGENVIDLILLDLVMPGMGGMEVLQTVKADREKRHIPVIMLSALDDSEQIVRCVMHGADDYLFKPYNPILLKARISASLEKSRLRKHVVPKLKVFISSPGDVIPERRILREIINNLNKELADEVFLKPVFWEDQPLLAHETFQAQIEPAEDSHIYVGIFWSRLGSPLPANITRKDGSTYDSGSEYEFETAKQGHEVSGYPKMLVYRKMAQAMVPLDDRETIMTALHQKEKVEAFVRRWFMTEDGTGFTSAFHCFNDDKAFEELVYTHMRNLVLSILSDKNRPA